MGNESTSGPAASPTILLETSSFSESRVHRTHAALPSTVPYTVPSTVASSASPLPP